ncbi:hypothetical protein [Janibacter alittae]|uniref:Uncharacterized protein n=1 Tax=Janibacter alittae TaxID=3115209 RepID=A0ABZ2MEZ4_9MICO
MPIDLPHVLSVTIGRPVWQRIPRGQPTGIGKQPVEVIHVSGPGPKRVASGAGVSGVDGDHVGDGRHHGGSDRGSGTVTPPVPRSTLAS